jgi:hypothetical protein
MPRVPPTRLLHVDIALMRQPKNWSDVRAAIAKAPASELGAPFARDTGMPTRVRPTRDTTLRVVSVMTSPFPSD